LQALIAPIEKRAEDAAKSPEDAGRHLVELALYSLTVLSPLNMRAMKKLKKPHPLEFQLSCLRSRLPWLR